MKNTNKEIKTTKNRNTTWLVLNKMLNILSYTRFLFLDGSAGVSKPRSVVRSGESKSPNSMMSQLNISAAEGADGGWGV